MANGGFKGVLKNGGFQAFLGTQFLGAFNDNAYRIIVSLRAVDLVRNPAIRDRYLAAAVALFVLPSLFFTGYAGHLADAFSKRKVLIAVKAFEILVMAAGILTLRSSSVAWMFVVLFLMAVHSTVFSPAKYSIVPEIVEEKDLSRGNALLEMSTLVAIILGIASGSFLYKEWKAEAWRIGVVLTGIAAAGFLASLRITRVPAAGAREPFRINPFAEIVTGTRHLLRDRPLWLAVLGISYFWFLGALFQSDLVDLGKETLDASDGQVGLLLACISMGIGAGAMLAGRLSGDKVEIGLVPLGSILLGGFSVAVWAASGSYAAALAALFLLGGAAGLFFVPLNAFLQDRAGDREKGRLIATNNVYNTVGMLLAAGVFVVCRNALHMSPQAIILTFGLATFLVTIYIVTVVDEYLIRFLLWMLTHTIFRIRIVGQENVPFRGPALLVSNHMSHADGFLVGASVQRFIRFMVWKPYYDMRSLNWFFRKTRAIPVGAGSPRDLVHAIRAARQELAGGHVVCIFAEGAISRTGNMLPFKRGMEKIVEGLDVPIVPVHLDRLWGSIFSFERGRFFWKWPRRVPYPVTVSFGAPMPAGSAAHVVRQAIQELSAASVAHRQTRRDTLGRRLAITARRNWSQFAMADSSGRELTYGRTLAGGLLVAGWVRRASAEEEKIGVLLPPTVAGALVNIGVTLAGRIPVNLNFTAGRDGMSAAIEQCGIRTIVTSKAFLAKARLEAMPGMVYVEDILARVSQLARVRVLLAARLAPARLICAKASPESLATVIFSSDRIVGVLPFFHSFGFTVTIWFPLIAGCGVVYHPNPMDAKMVGELIRKYRATLLLSTPTFCTGYIRKCSPEDFASLRFVVVGAEKLRAPVAAAFREKFGLDPLEGYGCTEMAPVVAVNSPNFDAGPDTQIGNKPGTVGHPLPGVAARIVDPVTFEPLPANTEGLLLVNGSNRMLGYLGQPERTAEVFRGDWYITGDIARIDDEGFLHITDRLSRFSKIAGEMVPHIRIEEAMAAAIGDVPCAVAGVPDDQRGERLVAMYVSPEVRPEELWQKLAAAGLPKLWVPKAENIYQVENLPVLGSGKLDLRGVRNLAQQLTGAGVSEVRGSQ
jgi:acyl-[acyl-carrier-protein]-phospholipid O-acyltransferase/long-chain-fatty-acid--[acyl-carrier-protein] ligase